MSSVHKQSKKQAAEPDQFLKTTTAYLDKAAASKSKVIAVAVGLLVLAIAISAAASFSKAKTQAAGEAFSAALELTKRPVSTAIGANDVNAFPSEKEKVQAVHQAFTKIRAEHAGTVAATSAAYYLAVATYQLGKFDEAYALYEEYLAKSTDDAPLRLNALEGLAYAAEARQDYSKAAEHFRKLAETSNSDPLLQARSYYSYARLLELAGKDAEAADAYAKVAKDFAGKNAAVVASAKQRLSQLSLKGVTPTTSDDASGANASAH